LDRAEVRDVLAWMRLLVDPDDAAAVVRALARRPIERRRVDLARVIQFTRRSKLDMVAALATATESPHIPPEARERIQRFLRLHQDVSAALKEAPPDLFVHRLIEHLGLNRPRPLAAPDDEQERRVSLARLDQLSAGFLRCSPHPSTRELACHLARISKARVSGGDLVLARPAGAPDGVAQRLSPPAGGERFEPAGYPGFEPAGGSGGGEVAGVNARVEPAEHIGLERPGENDGPEDPLGLADRSELAQLEATLRMMRVEVLDGVARIGGRLSELRLDTDLDISHGVVRYLELIKLAALLERKGGHSVADALGDINVRLLAACTSLQREIFLTSGLDETLLAGGLDERARARAIAPREELSLEGFLPRRGDGLVLSASDIDTYRGCPLRYKFARVLRIPSESTLNQRFGIVVHQVLERYHSAHGETLAQLMDLLDASWQRGGFGESEQERGLREKARVALARYHERLGAEAVEPVWFERSFAFQLGPHYLRGRVDRVDRLPDGNGYELIDYKTSRPKTAAQLKDDIQLSLYAVAARESWQLEAAQQAYYYILDDEKVPVSRGGSDAQWVTDIVLEVGEGILAQRFEPTPSPSVCAMCDYRIVCPVAEK
jgi:DNA helicase II / ATP-dependent DNA helicase PcrA